MIHSLDQIKKQLVYALENWGHREALGSSKPKEDPMFTKSRKRGPQAPVKGFDLTQISSEEEWTRLSDALVTLKEKQITEMYYIRFKGRYRRRVARKCQVERGQVTVISASAIDVVAMEIQKLEVKDYMDRMECVNKP